MSTVTTINYIEDNIRMFKEGVITEEDMLTSIQGISACRIKDIEKADADEIENAVEKAVWDQDETDRIARANACDGFCSPMCAFCNALADAAADNRCIDQGY